MSNMNTLEAGKTKIDRQVRTFRPILASSTSGETTLPTRIELLKIGMWDTSGHGMFMVTPEDLTQYKENYDNGVAQAGDSGIVIDFDHDSRFGKSVAAGWIKGLEIGNDDNGILTMFGIVEWTGLGKKELLEKNYKCISPEFYPESRGGWEDPEEYGHYIPNVLAAAGLVNRPLFKGLQPILASATSGEESGEDKNVIYLSASEKEQSMPTLEEVRGKDPSSLTEEEKSFLVEHKAELNAEEQSKFGFEVTAEVQETEEQKAERLAAETKAAEEKAAEEKAAAEKRTADALAAAQSTSNLDLTKAQPILASAIKGDEGNVVVAAAEVKALQDYKHNAEKKETEQLVEKHIARGAIVASEKDNTVKMLMTAGNRSAIEDMISKLPDHSVMASENGSSEKGGNAVTATAQIKEKAEAIVASAKTEGKTLDIGTAMSQVMKAEPELAKQYQNETQGKES
jgi:hypothetical protein